MPRRPDASTRLVSLEAEIGRLQRDRQQLRIDGADDRALEQNRLELVRAQREHAHALIDRYVPAPA